MNDTFLSPVLTDDTDTLDSDNDIETTPHDPNTLHRITQQLDKWLSSYPLQLTQKQFISLVRKCGICNDQKILELFYTLDYEANNLVHKDVLLQNDCLANLIAVCLFTSNYIPSLSLFVTYRVNGCSLSLYVNIE